MKVLSVLIQKVNPKTHEKEWALVSREDHAKILKWFGKTKPSDEEIKKQERRVQFFKHQKAALANSEPMYPTLTKVLKECE